MQSQYRYGNGRRMFYGSLWSLYTVLFAIGTISGFASGTPAVGLVGIVFFFLAAAYAYRIWTWQARRLWLLILF